MLSAGFTCETAEETRQLGELIGKSAQAFEVWSLSGALGAGKTHFVKGLAQGLGFAGNVTSPTFTLQHIYEGRLPLYHFDWYRLKKSSEVEELGWSEWLSKEGVVVVEWGDLFPALLPPTVFKMSFEIKSEESRRVIVEATAPESLPRLEELIRCWPL